MAREHNFLLGNGERLTAPVTVPSGGGAKKPPYDFGTAQRRIAAKLAAANQDFKSIPADASPGGNVVAVVTMHPRYISKTDFPQDLLNAVGLNSIGSRSRSVRPEKWGIRKHPTQAITEDLFVSGTRDAFDAWTRAISKWSQDSAGGESLTHLEDLGAFVARDKLRGIPTDREEALFEIVLHNAGGRKLIDAFMEYASRHGAAALPDKRRDVRGLTFLPVRAPTSRVEELAQFTFVRVARGMPSLRPLRPRITRTPGTFPVSLPAGQAVDVAHRAAIFDGGLSPSAQTALSPWVQLIEPPGIGLATTDYQAHGLGVTTAFLFGPLRKGISPALPLCGVDHVRVLDQRTGTNKDLEYVDVLDRILSVLDGEKKYDLVNISLGPNLSVNDDEITAWTAALDQLFAGGHVVAAVAAGNDGERDAASGLNRVQPPADGVNVLAVGAADKQGASWQRASYSCVGPGRSPGLVKPDGVSFGGELAGEPFMVLGDGLKAHPEEGTSFAAPFALRGAAAIRVQLGSSVSALAMRALLIHRAERGGNGGTEVGWGRFENEPRMLITCDDDEALVLYQGTLPVGEHLRAKVPLPTGTLQGSVVLTATLVIAPEVDPGHPGAYTRAGLEVSLRPHSGKFTTYDDGKRSQHPKTVSFFSASNMYGAAEYEFREDGHKWEPCLRNSRRFQAGSLKDPCLDIYYHQREAGGKVTAPPQPIPYALVVSVRAPKVRDLYNRVVRSHAGILLPLRPKVQIPIRT